jgi:hypothetical protein
MLSAESPTRHTRHSVGAHKAQGSPRLREPQGFGAPHSGVLKTQGSPRISFFKNWRSPRLRGHQGSGAPGLGAHKALGPEVFGASQS